MNLSEIVQSSGWRNFMAKLYGIGASVVIVGAMFKIQHWPMGGFFITLGLTTEAIIFFFSAFEPLHEELDWTLVYPELAGMTDPDEIDQYKEEAIAGRGVSLEKFDDLFKETKIDPEAINRLGQGLNNLSKTAGEMSDVAASSLATREYLEKMQTAAESMSSLTTNYNASSEVLNTSVGSLSESYKKTAELISKSGADVAAKFAQSGNDFANSYSQMTEQIKSDYSGITENNKSFGENLANMNKNLAALNAAYELQLKGTNEHLKGSEEAYQGLEDILKSLKDSVSETNKYKEEMGKLSQNLAELNNIYGNMLSAMNVK